jgi:hypothetical protein
MGSSLTWRHFHPQFFNGSPQLISVTRGTQSVNVATTGNLFSGGLVLPNATALAPSGNNIVRAAFQ